MSLSAAVADLSQIGITFPGFVPDCGSSDCAHCAAIRGNLSKTENEARKQARLTQSTEEFFENPQAMTIPGLIGEDDRTPSVLSGGESSLSTARRRAETDLEEICNLERSKELDSIGNIMWNTADREQPELLSQIDERCGFKDDEDYEMVNLDEAQIGLIEIDNAHV